MSSVPGDALHGKMYSESQKEDTQVFLPFSLSQEVFDWISYVQERAWSLLNACMSKKVRHICFS